MFIATSIVPMPAPQPASTANSCQADPANVVSGSITLIASTPIWTSRRGETLASSAPVTGIVSIEPIAGPSRTSPSVPADRCSPALIAGMRAAHAPVVAPSAKKTATTAARGATVRPGESRRPIEGATVRHGSPRGRPPRARPLLRTLRR